jgi:hypothetical protein
MNPQSISEKHIGISYGQVYIKRYCTCLNQFQLF